MAELSVLYDREGRTLTVWFTDRYQESLCTMSLSQLMLVTEIQANHWGV
jgi:hypothetical protein